MVEDTNSINNTELKCCPFCGGNYKPIIMIEGDVPACDSCDVEWARSYPSEKAREI